MKRALDIFFAILLGLLFIVPMILVAASVRITSKGPAIYWSNRVGRHNRNFMMPKFRTMNVSTPALATHLLKDADSFMTPVGAFLRRTSLDELPQLWCILTGTMTFVGPRPALFNQDDLIRLRKAAGVDTLAPGLTGWAQVNGRDKVTVAHKVKLDVEYLKNQSLWLDLKILFLTFAKVIGRKEITH